MPTQSHYPTKCNEFTLFALNNGSFCLKKLRYERSRLDQFNGDIYSLTAF